MSSFDSLTLALERWFDKPLCDLPDALRQRVEEEFFLMPWDKFSAEERRRVALQLDYPDDPATEQERHFCWDLAECRFSIETKIAEWEAILTPTALDLAEKQKQLAELRQELARIEAEVFVEGGPIENPCIPAQPTKRQTGSEHLQALADTTAPEKAQGSTVRREARKLETQAMYKQWQKAYRAAIKKRPNMSDTWYSQYIAKMEIAKNRDPCTIKKHMKS